MTSFCQHSCPTILLIDGADDDRQYWKHRLKITSPEYKVLEAQTGKAGLAICKSNRVDCVVTELDLPDMSGFSVLVNLVPRPNRPNVAVLILSRQSVPHLRELALYNGGQTYLVKSRCSGDDLDKAIRKALAAVAPTCKEPREEPFSHRVDHQFPAKMDPNALQ